MGCKLTILLLLQQEISRANEVDGVDYYFYTSEQMTEKLLNDELGRSCCVLTDGFMLLNIKHYQKTKLMLVSNNLAGAEALAQNPELETYIIYLDVEDSVRLIRYLDRDEMTKDKIREMFRRL